MSGPHAAAPGRNPRAAGVLLRRARVGDRVVDIRLDGGLIEGIAPRLERRASDEVVDLDGRWVVPGLWDQHAHVTQWSLSRRRLDLEGAASAAEAADRVRQALRDADGGGDAGADAIPFVGQGFRDGLWPDAPGRELLDGVSGDRPVVLIAADLHSCWLNSAALRRSGRPAEGDGVLREEDCFAVVRALDDVPDDILDRWVREAGGAAAARGVVGVVDMEMTWNRDPWLRRLGAGFDSQRVRFGVYPQHLERAAAEGLATGLRPAPLLEVGPLKVISDGSLNTRTAFCAEPYAGVHRHAHGVLTVPGPELVALLRRAAAVGLVPAVHAIGDEANRIALDAFQEAGVGGRIEHAQLLHRRDVPRFARLGVAASVQPEHAMDDRDVAERYWPGRTDRAFPLRELLDAGARVVFGSDAPVAPLDPWLAIAAAVGRDRDGRDPWHPEQRIRPDEALAASVESGVQVGQPADLAVLDADPASTDSTVLRTMPVAATLLAGRFTHRLIG